MDEQQAARRRAGVAAVFDRVADTYDAVGVPWFGPIAAALVEAVSPRPGDAVLDLGCGRGAALFPLAEAVGPTGSVTGLDLAPRMVEATAADVRARGLAHVDVRVLDAADSGLPERSYDLAVASLVLFFLPDPAAAVRAWAALLRPGGRLGVSTFGRQDDAWRAVDEVFTPHLPPQMLDARTTGRSGPFATDEGVEGLLAGAGLVDVTTTSFAAAVTFDDVGHWRRWSRSHGQRALWDAVGPDHEDAVLAAAAERLEAARASDGRITLGQRVRLTTGWTRP